MDVPCTTTLQGERAGIHDVYLEGEGEDLERPEAEPLREARAAQAYKKRTHTHTHLSRPALRRI
jgi:hypothetical protein